MRTETTHGVTIQWPDYAPPLRPMTVRDTHTITDLIIHHSAGAVTQTALDIDAEHRNLQPPDAMIAYNYVILHDGTIQKGRDICYVPAAAYGRNPMSISICVVGNFQRDDAGYTGPPTDSQMASLTALSVLLHVLYPTISRTFGHGDIAPMFYGGDSNYATVCPGNDLHDRLPDLRRAISARMVGKK